METKSVFLAYFLLDICNYKNRIYLVFKGKNYHRKGLKGFNYASCSQTNLHRGNFHQENKETVM